MEKDHRLVSKELGQAIPTSITSAVGVGVILKCERGDGCVSRS